MQVWKEAWFFGDVQLGVCMEGGIYFTYKYSLCFVLWKGKEFNFVFLFFVCLWLLYIKIQLESAASEIFKPASLKTETLPQSKSLTSYFPPFVNINRRSWPVSAWYYSLCCCHMIDWLDAVLYWAGGQRFLINFSVSKRVIRGHKICCGCIEWPGWGFFLWPSPVLNAQFIISQFQTKLHFDSVCPLWLSIFTKTKEKLQSGFIFCFSCKTAKQIWEELLE